MYYLSVYFYGFWPIAVWLYTECLRILSLSLVYIFGTEISKNLSVSNARIDSLLCWTASQILFVSGCYLSLKTVGKIQLRVISMIALNIICWIGIIIPPSKACILPVSLQHLLWLPEINGEICKGQSLQWHIKIKIQKAECLCLRSHLKRKN